MNYPDCPEQREDCRFQDEGYAMTSMHSPIVRDRSGKPVGGGCNRVSRSVLCVKCKNRWLSRATELEDAQGVAREWELT